MSTGSTFFGQGKNLSDFQCTWGGGGGLWQGRSLRAEEKYAICTR